MVSSMNSYYNHTTDKDVLRKRCDAMLMALLGKDQLVDMWWASDNIYFGLAKPSAVFDDNPQAVYNYLVTHCI